jgi:hypothetical protein
LRRKAFVSERPWWCLRRELCEGGRVFLIFNFSGCLIDPQLRASPLSLVKQAQVASLVIREASFVGKLYEIRFTSYEIRTPLHERRITLELCEFREHRGLTRPPARTFLSGQGGPALLSLLQEMV